MQQTVMAMNDADGVGEEASAFLFKLATGERIDGTLRQGSLHGRCTIINEDSSPLHEADYLSGKLHGESRHYLNGRLVGLQHYVMGQLDGPSQSFDAAGNVVCQVFYAAGQLEGPAQWFQEGVLIREGSFHHGLPEGEWHHYDEGGRRLESMTYQQGLLHGPACRYGADGELAAKRLYQGGKPQAPWAPVSREDAGPQGSRLERWLRGGS